MRGNRATSSSVSRHYSEGRNFIFTSHNVLVRDDDNVCVERQQRGPLWKPSQGLSRCRGRGDGREDIVSRKFPEYDQGWNIHLDIQLDHGSAVFDCDPNEEVHLSPARLGWFSPSLTATFPCMTMTLIAVPSLAHHQHKWPLLPHRHFCNEPHHLALTFPSTTAASLRVRLLTRLPSLKRVFS